MKTKHLPQNPRLLAAAALVAAQRAPDQFAGVPALFITHNHTEEVARLRAENAALKSAQTVPAAPELPPRAIGEYRKSDRTPAEREALVAKVLTSERINGKREVYNSLREIVKWHSKPAQWFTKPTLEIWTK